MKESSYKHAIIQPILYHFFNTGKKAQPKLKQQQQKNFTNVLIYLRKFKHKLEGGCNHFFTEKEEKMFRGKL